MSKLRCPCGFVFVDQSDGIDWRAQVVSDVDAVELLDSVSSAAASLAQAVSRGRRDDWIVEHLGDGYPTHVPDQGAFSDLVVKLTLDRIRTLYKCPECGRLSLQQSPGSGAFRFFTEEGPD